MKLVLCLYTAGRIKTNIDTTDQHEHVFYKPQVPHQKQLIKAQN